MITPVHVMLKKILHIFLHTLKWIIIGLLSLVLLVILLLYIPAVQDKVVSKVLSAVNSPAMQVSIGKFRLSFPLTLTVDDLKARMDSADMDIAASRISLDVKPLSLLSGKVKVGDVRLSDARYRMHKPDSLFYLSAVIDSFVVDDLTYLLSAGDIDLSEALLDGADVRMTIREDSTVAPVDTTSSSTSMKILAGSVALRNLRYFMSIENSIDSLSADIKSATLSKAAVNLGASSVDARSFVVNGVNAAYFHPLAAADDSSPADSTDLSPDSVSSVPWTIRADKVQLLHSSALYAASGVEPLPGLDMNYIQVSDVTIDVDSLFNQGALITVPIRRIAATERCGLTLDGSGTFAMDSVGMHIRDFALHTAQSVITVNALMGLSEPGKGMTQLPVNLDAAARIGIADIMVAMPSLSPMLRNVPVGNPLTVKAYASGTMNRMTLDTLSLSLPRSFSLSASGWADGLDSGNIEDIDASVKLDGHLYNSDFIRPTLVEAKLGKNGYLPPIALRGRVNASDGTFSGTLRGVTDGGSIALDGSLNATRESYRASLDARDLPVHSFMPSLGVGPLSASVKASGRGFDPMKKSTTLEAKADVTSVVYQGTRLSGISLDAALADGSARIAIVSSDPVAHLSLDAAGNLAGRSYDWTLNSDIQHINLQALGLSDVASSGNAAISGRAYISPDSSLTRASLSIDHINWNQDKISFGTRAINLDFDATDSSTHALLTNQDLRASVIAPVSLDSLLSSFTRFSAGLDTMLSRQILNVDSLMPLLPPLDISISARRNNIISNYLAQNSQGFQSFDLNAATRPALHLDATVMRLAVSSSLLIDSVAFNMNQQADSIVYNIDVHNRPGNLDEWTDVAAHGRISGDDITLLLTQRNLEGKVGYNLGTRVIYSDSTFYVRIEPSEPLIAYKRWKVNPDNYISYNLPHRHLDADLSMGNGVSSLRLYTSHIEGEDADKDEQEEINLDLTDVKIADWIALNPFAPPISGDLSAALHVKYDDSSINGHGKVGLKDFTYGRERVGDFDVDLSLLTDVRGVIRADASIDVDSIRAVTASGVLNDTTMPQPLMLDLAIDSFPLSVANPFIGSRTATLIGALNGDIAVTGTMERPVFNGYLQFDSTAVKVAMLGTNFILPDKRIPLDSGVVRFSDYGIRAVNNNPLSIDGVIDLRNFALPAVDLTLNARDMQIVGNQRRGSADVYGKAFIDLKASARGNLRMLRVNADLSLLPTTNVTYVMSTMTSDLTSVGNSDMVKFVNFADTMQVAKADSLEVTGMLMKIDANLHVMQGSTISVDLSTDGKNKVQIQGEGNLDYAMDFMGDQTLTGRFNINSGFARYSPPLMSQKLFNFQSDSYVSFNGDIMNPVLNIHAVDPLKANVTQEGQNSRLITFDVGLNVTGTLANMNVSFDLSTDDDITVANELKSMTAEQRANQAMNLLLYNIYTGPNTTGNANIGGNALFSFLESKLNSWAADNIKGVDLSFGIDQYDRTVNGSSSTTTSYSYKVSKSLFNDRFKIVVGGNYSTDANTDENFSQNLINDISFEYLLNQSGSMLVRLFRHTGYENILDGEITQTGVGFVYKRKLNSLRNFFKFRASRAAARRRLEEAERLRREREAAEQEALSRAAASDSTLQIINPDHAQPE